MFARFSRDWVKKSTRGFTMTEQNSGENQNQSTSVSSSVSNSSVAPAAPEKTLRQSEVNELIGRIKHESYQKGKSEALSEFQTHTQVSAPQAPPMQSQQPYAAQSVGGIPQLTPDQIRAQIVDEMTRAEQVKNYKQVVDTFVSKLESGKGKYEDFDKVAATLNLPQIPAIWQTAANFDNPADIIYELGNNPSKLSSLLTIAYSPELVKKEMQKLSDSLKQNDAADEKKVANAPLRRPETSNVGMGNGKSLKAQDWKKILRT